jgi:hypothetical protein
MSDVQREMSGTDPEDAAKQKAKELEDEAQKLLDKAKELRNSL